MAVVKCPSGHHYDNNKYDKCPHCGEDEDILNVGKIRKEDFEETIGLQLSSGIYEKTIPLDMIDNSIGEYEKTIGVYSFEKGTNLITGWIVCVKGPAYGKAYDLYHGKNRIGRGLNMDIYIPDDKSISSDEHSTIVYEGKNNEFFLINNQENTTLINGKSVNEVETLRNGDKITMGSSDFIFIAFCTEERRWEEEF